MMKTLSDAKTEGKKSSAVNGQVKRDAVRATVDGTDEENNIIYV